MKNFIIKNQVTINKALDIAKGVVIGMAIASVYVIIQENKLDAQEEA